MGGFYRTRGSNRFGVLITFHVLTHVIDLKNPRPPRWGGSLAYPPRGTRVGPTWDPDGPPNPMIPYGIHGGLVGYVAASRRLSRGVGAAPGEPGGTATFADETYGLPKYTSD